MVVAGAETEAAADAEGRTVPVTVVTDTDTEVSVTVVTDESSAGPWGAGAAIGRVGPDEKR